jgi:hypothetical protein
MRYTLCVIDVQKRFPAHKKILRQVIKQRKLAMKDEAGIMIVEFNGSTSHKKIYRVLKEYNKYKIVKKNKDCGTTEIISTMKNTTFLQSNNLRICGINACACVRSTAYGLKQSNNFHNIKIIPKATTCNCITPKECLATTCDIISDKLKPNIIRHNNNNYNYKNRMPVGLFLKSNIT